MDTRIGTRHIGVALEETMITHDLQWNEYVPEDSREFDLCPCCRSGKPHTVALHKRLVRRAKLSGSKRADALLREARVVYDND